MKVIVIRNGLNAKVATIPSSSPVPLAMVLRIIAICAGVDPIDVQNNYELRELAAPAPLAMDPVQAKHYVIRHRTDVSRHLIPRPSEGLPTLFPSRKRAAESMSGSDTSLSRLEDATSEVSRLQAVEDLPAAEVVRYAKFTVQVAARDQACIVTNDDDVENCVGAHIIPHAWARHGIQFLPENVRLKLDETGNGLNDVTNGIYLSSQLHHSFDKGYWSVVWETNSGEETSEVGDHVKGSWKIVRLHVRAPEFIVGKSLQIPTDRTGQPWHDRFPPAVYWNFHFLTAVLANCRGGAESDEPYTDDYDKFAHQLAFLDRSDYINVY